MCSDLIRLGGPGHTAAIHIDPRERQRIELFANATSASRILVNMPTSHGAIGDIYNFHLSPSFTLGTGAKGGSIISENVILNLSVFHI
jgi:acetaldehyde dehydrogenase / alcohol dehydrogenase